jgi:hypothetical protein
MFLDEGRYTSGKALKSSKARAPARGEIAVDNYYEEPILGPLWINAGSIWAGVRWVTK